MNELQVLYDQRNGVGWRRRMFVGYSHTAHMKEKVAATMHYSSRCNNAGRNMKNETASI